MELVPVSELVSCGAVSEGGAEWRSHEVEVVPGDNKPVSVAFRDQLILQLLKISTVVHYVKRLSAYFGGIEYGIPLNPERICSIKIISS